jgi:cytochrome c biogenesis protein ResB
MLVSRIQGTAAHPDAINYNEVDTSTTAGFNWASVAIVLILTGLYATWW